jgi:putative flippase GtrA
MPGRFVVAGAINTLCTYLLYLLLVGPLPYLVAYSVTYVAGIVLGYFLNAWWVFRAQPDWKSAAAYPAAYVANYLLGAGLLWGFVQLGVPVKLAPLLVVPVCVPVMYFASRYIFRRNP